MITRVLCLLFLLALSSGVAKSQSSIKGLTPGKSTRVNVENAFGPAVRQISATLSEYKSNLSTEQVFVQYQSGGNDIARIEVVYSYAVERSVVLKSLQLTKGSIGWQINSKKRLEEYFSDSCVVLTYLGSDASTGVSRAGFYSRELFNNTSVKLTLSSKNLPGLNAASTAKNSSAQPTPPVADYDTLITRANSATQSRDFQTTIKLAQQAMAIDPNRPEAYQSAGIAQLYGLQDFEGAAVSLRAARRRGGSVLFIVNHDHDGSFGSYCQGTLQIVNFGISYTSNTESKHSFLISHDSVTSVGVNTSRSDFSSFHIKTKQKGKVGIVNLAPQTLTTGESNLIVELLNAARQP